MGEKLTAKTALIKPSNHTKNTVYKKYKKTRALTWEYYN
jgi:hypothetical protein